ncbi:FAD-dependent monooxygenase [Rhodococcoides yunnanense]|uniref:FAD-dependent monooxygenase n=1 Tax=Rhodococcoides yunnanense TaxID=278209 RepID=A0ABU4BIA6_9NOCA|nr:FAD-dependent monooxygenase [Rhodococcus yunnanensis]MDV6263944.1 FAD-dependent monooxygenase [Rhodococcus yunnanensis]
MTDVIIAGAGPTGLMLACELRLAGTDVLVIERRSVRTYESRAGGMHARSVELMDQRGIADRFLAAGQTGPLAHFSFIPLDMTGLPTRHPYALAVHQSRVEQILEERATELGVRLRWDSEVVDLHEDASGVDVQVATGQDCEQMRAGFIVGCDGGRSTVRKLAGIGFSGTPATLTALMGDVSLDYPPPGIVFGESGRRENGSFMVFESEPGVRRVITMEFGQVAGRNTPVDLEMLRASCMRIAGTDFGMHSPTWLSSFNDAAFQAHAYRMGRVLLAGDAAHINFPSSGQGMNLGLQDAVNLGWKLSAVVAGRASADLLESYETERKSAADTVLESTRAQTALWRPDAQINALRAIVGSLVELEDCNRHLVAACTQLDVRYSFGSGHPLVGRRMPDLDLVFESGCGRVFDLLHSARPVLLDLTDNASFSAVIDGWSDRVDLVRADCRDAHWTCPGIGDVSAAPAVLMRPDGHVAWVADREMCDDSTLTGLEQALKRWFGPPLDG